MAAIESVEVDGVRLRLAHPDVLEIRFNRFFHGVH